MHLFWRFFRQNTPFWAGKAYHKGKKAVEQMSEFLMSYEMIAQRYGPGYQGYPLFGAVHLGELEAVAVCILLTARWYRRTPGTHPAAHPVGRYGFAVDR